MMYCLIRRLGYMALLWILLAYCPGCYRGLAPEKVDSMPNSFCPGVSLQTGNIRSIEVKKHSGSTTEIVWFIAADTAIPAKDFVVTVGEIPKGFTQHTPEKTKTFVPQKGHEYEIFIWGDLWPGDLKPIYRQWIAE